jgi:ParB/RepB/Spo0J family partition protein
MKGETIMDNDKREKIHEIALTELHPFKNHPFHVEEDDELHELAKSIADHGVVTPGIVRPKPEGGYELISGHRRKAASELAGMATMAVVIRELDDDAATIIMVDSNQQRENLLPSEKAFAYKMKLEAMKHQGKTTSCQLGTKLRTDAEIAESLKGKAQVFITDVMKTDASKRTLPLIPQVREELLKHKARQEEYRRSFGRSYCKEWTGCVCVDPTGNILSPDFVTRHFGLLLTEHGLRHIRFHDLRHTCASLLVAQGVPMKQIQLWLGHSTYSTTADIYSHLSTAAMAEPADCIADLLTGPEKESDGQSNIEKGF